MRGTVRSLFLRIAGLLKHPQAGVHIINSHYVTAETVSESTNYEIFENYLEYLNTFSRFISLKEATTKILKNDLLKKEVLITFTFDDGFEECYTIIAPLLEKYNCRGAFFINANYIESDEKYQEEFNKRVAISTKKPMSWDQVIDLHKRGHLIGAHNLDHTNFETLTAKEIDFQLKKNKEILEDKLDYQCEYFAWTYGQLHHFPVSALSQTEKYHKYIFSGTNYKKYFSYDGRVLNRRHLEPNWPKNHLRYFLATEKK